MCVRVRAGVTHWFCEFTVHLKSNSLPQWKFSWVIMFADCAEHGRFSTFPRNGRTIACMHVRTHRRRPPTHKHLTRIFYVRMPPEKHGRLFRWYVERTCRCSARFVIYRATRTERRRCLCSRRNVCFEETLRVKVAFSCQQWISFASGFFFVLQSRNELEKDISWCELGVAGRSAARHRGSENSQCPALSLLTAAGAMFANAD